MPGIFLSYRRADAAASAGRLFTSLSQYVGAEHIFRDVASIEAGEDFEQAIRDALEKAAVVLIVIGQRWLDLRAPDGTRRIDDPLDYVRREIELALAGDALVIPVLVDGATMPAAESLPMTIRDLAKRNALEFSDRRWDADVQDLLRQLVRRGVAAVEVDTGSARRTYRLSIAAIGEFIPGFFSLLRQPRRFLVQRATGGSFEIVRAFVFLFLTELIGLAMLLSVYTPKGSVIGFGLVALTLPVVASIALSAPLWAAARLVGATDHYEKLLIILLHQAAILQLAVLASTWMIVAALDLRSFDVVRETLHEALQPGSSFDMVLERAMRTLQPVAAANEVQLAIFAAVLLVLATLAWTLWSCGAYRQALELSRARSIAALLLLAAMVWALSRLLL